MSRAEPFDPYFNPRIPYGMRLVYAEGVSVLHEISIHASRMGCDNCSARPGFPGIISIHASRMGCDYRFRFYPTPEQISIHASRMGCDLHGDILRRARLISIHASRMGCDSVRPPMWEHLPISIHASRMGCDRPRPRSSTWWCYFNPRIPYGMRRDQRRSIRLSRPYL